MSGWGSFGKLIFGQTVAAEHGKAVVRSWYHEGKTGQGRGFRGYKVTRMKLFPAAIDDEEVLATFERPPDGTVPFTLAIGSDPSLELAAAFAADWNAGGARRERALREAEQ